jgi:hypothetical protein
MEQFGNFQQQDLKKFTNQLEVFFDIYLFEKNINLHNNKILEFFKKRGKGGIFERVKSKAFTGDISNLRLRIKVFTSTRKLKY